MVKVSALSGLAKGSETVRDYLSHGSDENQGVEAGEKTADTSSKLIFLDDNSVAQWFNTKTHCCYLHLYSIIFFIY